MRPRKSVILVVEPEPQLCRLIQMQLGAQEYDVVTASDGVEALKIFEELPIDLVILEMVMPGLGGNEFCRSVREISSIPIIVLSVRATEADKVTALDLGADDYLIKPFGSGEFLARVRVALRHGVRDLRLENGVYSFGELSIDLATRRMMRNGLKIRLTPTEFALLSLLVRNAGKVLTHRYILEAVWGPAYREERDYLRAYIYNLRKKIEVDARSPQLILGVSGVGYQFNSGVHRDKCSGCGRPFNQPVNGNLVTV